jgi:Tfp pilus assembly protein PilV
MIRSHHEPPSHENGSSLIEVLAALVLLSLVGFSLLVIFAPVACWIGEARHETSAAFYAAAILENLRSEREKVDPSNAGKTAQQLALAAVAAEPGLENVISRMEPRDTWSNLYDVTVTISWVAGVEVRSLNLSTIIRSK